MNQRERAVLVFLGVCLLFGAGIYAFRRASLARRTASSPLTVVNPVDADQPADRLLDLNNARQYELEALPGIGPVLASRIAQKRRELGRFERVDQLLDVTGIGPKRYAAIRDLVSVGGSFPDSAAGE
ncbi:MAG: helix-hairpin-helix domain-containing protein [candidate division WOR-3 bacterium]|nr:MAG: helix-hairpin-helix domain-containing protein [candidate division WOR-3 bacterium]